MFRAWSLFTAVAVLTAQVRTGQNSCDIWSTAGKVVQHGSSFRVYCTFKCKNEKVMRSNHPPTPLTHTHIFNSTTIYYNVVNIKKTRTFSCQGSCPYADDPCGMDIKPGYPPERPKILSCIYNVSNNQTENVTCTWNRGRDTLIITKWTMRVTSVSGNHTAEPVQFTLSDKEAVLSATFPVSRSVQLISVDVQAQNYLGSAVSVPVNYTLRDIAMPCAPVLGRPECSSRKCNITVEQAVSTQHLEIQYVAEAENWTSYLYSDVQMSELVSVSSLEPFKLYHFRGRSKLSSGNWSLWSKNLSSWTQEEPPSKELDVWYTEDASDFKSLIVYWKELDISSARGQIIQYSVSVYSQTMTLLFTSNISAEARNCSVPFCAHCEVKVWAYNSKGVSPPARIRTHHKIAKYSQDSQDVHVAADNHSVAISWRKADTAVPRAEYVVEWYPEGRRLQELRWVRLGGDNKHFVITGMRPAECFEGTVYFYYSDHSMDQTRFTSVILDSIPAAGPSVQENVDGNNVRVTWKDVPRAQRGGCITNYTIYTESSGHQQHYCVQASARTYTIQGLSPAFYSLWLTASTARGEGPEGQKIKFFIKDDNQLSIYLVCTVLLIVLFLVILCQFSTVNQRIRLLFKCLVFDAVLDPANSKWAKECTEEKGKMNLHLPSTNISVAEEEEEPILVDVEELPNQGSDTQMTPDISSQLDLQKGLSPLKEPPAVTTYIKSFSLDSDSSDQTHTSLDTDSTVDYISSHGLGNMEEEEEGEMEEFPETASFFPCHNIFTALKFGGTLTLDSVKINCNDFFDASEC